MGPHKWRERVGTDMRFHDFVRITPEDDGVFSAELRMMQKMDDMFRD